MSDDPIRELQDLVENGSATDKCPDCNGTGMSMFGMLIFHVPMCLKCAGTGKNLDKKI